MTGVLDNGCGFKLKIKWVIVEAAPLTASGLNEIVGGADTSSAARYLAKGLGIKVTPKGQYQLHKLADIYQK